MVRGDLVEIPKQNPKIHRKGINKSSHQSTSNMFIIVVRITIENHKPAKIMVKKFWHPCRPS